MLTFTTWIGEPQAHGPAGSPDDATGTSRAAAGYHVCLDSREVLLDEDTAGPLAEADAERLEAESRTLL